MTTHFIHWEHPTHLFPTRGPRTPATARTQTTKTVAGIALTRSGIGWRPAGTRIELTLDESNGLWFVDLGTGDWFFARSLCRGVEALKAKGLL